MDGRPGSKGFFNYQESWIFNVWVHAGLIVKILTGLAVLYSVYFLL